MDFSKLSCTVQKKTKKLLELKEKLDKKRTSWKLPAGISCILVFYIFLYNDRYISYATAAFENTSSKSSVKGFDLSVLVIFAATMFILFTLFDKIKKAKKSYNELRADLIKTINNEFCSCKNTNNCTCKDEYIKYMEEKDIDLIFL